MINILLKQSKEIQLNNSLCVKFVSTTNIAKKIFGGVISNIWVNKKKCHVFI